MYKRQFLNRVDESVVFHPLGQEHIKSIASIQLQRLSKRMEERGYALEVSDKALDLIAQVGFDPVYGARPLKRAIQQSVENPLAKAYWQGKLCQINRLSYWSVRSDYCPSMMRWIERALVSPFCFHLRRFD